MEHDGNAVMAAFANAIEDENNIRGPRDLVAAPVMMRPVGAQAVTVKRDVGAIFRSLRQFAAAAGEAWYYSWDVNDKHSKRPDKKTTIEGASVKLANDLARLYGNCSNGVSRIEDVGTHWIIHAQFVDFETGYEYNRPFRQRKSQGAGQGMQADRQEDIAFQIGNSKAIRNCVVNALGTFSDFALAEAKAAIVGRVEKDLDRYRIRVVNRLEELGVPLQRVERLVGVPHGDWTAKQVAKLIAEIQAVGEGMTTPEEAWPIDAPKDEPPKPGKLENFAGGNDAPNKPDDATGTDAATPAGGQAAPEGGAVRDAAPVVVEQPATPKTEAKPKADPKPKKDEVKPKAQTAEDAKRFSETVGPEQGISGDAFPGDTPLNDGAGLSGSDKSPEQIARNKAETIAARPKPKDAAGQPVQHDPATGEAEDIPSFLRRTPDNQVRGISQDPENRQPPEDEHVQLDPHEDTNHVAKWHPDKPPAWISGYIARSVGDPQSRNPFAEANPKISNAWLAGWLTRDAMDDVMPM